MLNIVSGKNDNKVESKESKRATVNDVIELKNCSLCLFYEMFNTKKCIVSFFQPIKKRSFLNWYSLYKACKFATNFWPIVIVSLQQLKGLLGITHFTTMMQIVPVIFVVFQRNKRVVLANNCDGVELLNLLTHNKANYRASAKGLEFAITYLILEFAITS